MWQASFELVKALLYYAIFSATCLAMVENLAFQVAEIWCWGPVTLCNFLSNLSRNAPLNEKQEVCACALVKTAVKLRDKLLEGWYTVQWCCQLLQSVAISRAEFCFVQRFAQQKNCDTTHVTLCNSPATCLATALRDKLLRKLHSVTGPLMLHVCMNNTIGSLPCWFLGGRRFTQIYRDVVSKSYVGVAIKWLCAINDTNI